MGKKILLFITIIIFNNLCYSQFKINGYIKNYPFDHILIKKYENGVVKNIDIIKLNDKKTFDFKIKKSYNGIINICTPDNTKNNIYLLSNNKNLSFKGEFNIKNDNIENVIILDNAEAELYLDYTKNKELYNKRINILTNLKKLYEKNNKFYNIIHEEINSLNEEKNKIEHSINNTKYNTLSRMIKVKNDINDIYKNFPIQTEKIENVLISKVNNNILENSGEFKNLIFQYIENKTGDNIYNISDNQIISIINDLSNKCDINSNRFRNIIYVILNNIDIKYNKKIFELLKQKYNSNHISILDNDLNLILNTPIIKIGKKVPNIIFKNKKKAKSLYNIQSPKKLIIFWASWCPACKETIKILYDNYDKIKLKGYEIISISLDFNLKTYLSTTKNFRWYTYTDLLKWDSPYVNIFNINSTPTIYIIDKKNILIKTMSSIKNINDIF